MIAFCLDAMRASLLAAISMGAGPAVVRTIPAVAPARAAAALPWEGAERIPADVDLYIHVDGAAELRRRMQNLPLSQAFAALFVDDEVASRWSGIARRLGRGEEQCFDELLGRELRFVMRRGEGGADWLLATELDDATLARVREGLGGRMGSGGFIEFPCQGLVAAWREPVLLVAPSRESPLFVAAIAESEAPRAKAAADGAGGGAAGTTMLADEPLVARARRWPSSQLQLYARHPAPFDGASVVSAEFGRRTATIRHRTRLGESMQGGDGDDASPIDTAVLERFEAISMFATVRRQCGDSLASIVDGVLPGCSPCPEMRQNSGERWLMAIGEAEPRGAVSCRVPALAVAIEVREACAGRRQHEAFLRRAIEIYNERHAAKFGTAVEPPVVAACTDLEAPRHCDITQPLRAASANHPLLRTCSLYWRTVAGDGTNWQVYATHPEWLEQVSLRLEEGDTTRREPVTATLQGVDAAPGDGVAAAAPASDAIAPGTSEASGAPGRPGARGGMHAAPPRRITTNAATAGEARGARAVRTARSVEGFVNGAALATMLESWGGDAEEFAAEDPERFRRGVTLLASLLHGIEWLRWGGTSVERGAVESTVWIDLAPPSAP